MYTMFVITSSVHAYTMFTITSLVQVYVLRNVYNYLFLGERTKSGATGGGANPGHGRHRGLVTLHMRVYIL